jgi:hypothetical protein
MYEYKIEKLYPLPISEEQLNHQAKHNWELIAAITTKEHNRITDTYIYYFKRLV